MRAQGHAHEYAEVQPGAGEAGTTMKFNGRPDVRCVSADDTAAYGTQRYKERLHAYVRFSPQRERERERERERAGRATLGRRAANFPRSRNPNNGAAPMNR